MYFLGNVLGVILFFIIPIVGIITILIGALTGIFVPIMMTKERLNAICPNCQKFYGNIDNVQGIEYSYVCTSYRDNYDKQTGNYKDTTYYYSITIQCPHCGNTNVISKSTTQKNASKADQFINKHIQNSILGKYE